MKSVTIKDFLSSDFRSFSLYDCECNIPSMVDGMKVSQRKVMWTMLNHPKTITAEQLASLAAAYTRYHHGATNLADVIVKLAQNFTGKANVNWLVPDGQFGNILNHNASSPRYISTSLHKNWNTWFKKEDSIITEYAIEDGEITEPTYFVPLVPVLLFNGASGIGTGYACNLLAYNPKDVVANVKKAIAGKPLDVMTPWYDGYTGVIAKSGKQTTFNGVFDRMNATTIRITQLPIGYDMAKYKEHLIKLLESGEIKNFASHSTEAGWDIRITASREWVKQHESIIIDKLKLVTRDTENIVVWDEAGSIRRFDAPEQLIEHFVKWRIGKFDTRRQLQIAELEAEKVWLTEKRRFIEFFIQHSKRLVSLSKQLLEDELRANDFVNIDRLLQIRVYNLTADEVAALDKELADNAATIVRLNSTTASQMYLDELKQLK